MADALAGTGFGAGIGFHGEYGTEVVLQCPACVAALFCQPVVVLGDARRLENAGLVGDEFVGVARG